MPPLHSPSRPWSPRKYGFSHPDLPCPIPAPTRGLAEAVVNAWPGARLVSQSSESIDGVHGRRLVWTGWTPVLAAPGRDGAAVTGQMLIPAVSE